MQHRGQKDFQQFGLKQKRDEKHEEKKKAVVTQEAQQEIIDEATEDETFVIAYENGKGLKDIHLDSAIQLTVSYFKSTQGEATKIVSNRGRHNLTTYKCNFQNCKSKPCSLTNVIRHMKTHSEIFKEYKEKQMFSKVNGKYNCHFCKKQFNLNVPMALHSEECKYSTKDNLDFLEKILKSIQCREITVHGTWDKNLKLPISINSIEEFKRTKPLGDSFLTIPPE